MSECAFFQIRQGETFSATSFFAYWDPPSQTLINYDLAGVTLLAHVRATPDESGPVLATLAIGTGFTLETGTVQNAAPPNPPTNPNGWTATIAASVTATLGPDVTYYYDVFVTFPSGAVQCLQSVQLTVSSTTGST